MLKQAWRKLAADKSGVTDSFDSIYRIVYQLTMRTIACVEIADDPILLARTLRLYESLASTATPLSVTYLRDSIHRV